MNGIPAAVIAYGKPSVSHLPAYNIYYSTPVHDFRFPLNPVKTKIARPFDISISLKNQFFSTITASCVRWALKKYDTSDFS